MAQSIQHKTAIVVGAGFAGIKAAVDLNAKGIDTLVLEARDRIGGRTYTYKSPVTGRKYDIGASWFHEVGFNPLFKKYVKDTDLSFTFDDASAAVIGVEGEIPASYKLGQVVAEMKLFASKESDESLNLHTLSNRYISENKDVLSKEQIDYAPQLLRMSEIMAGHWDTSNGCKANAPYGGRDAFVVSNYEKIIEKELNGFPDDNIKLSSPVKVIKKDKIITIETEGGDIYTCDYCIITIPQSVITAPAHQKGAVEFTPPLPSYISKPFDKLATISLAKVAFEFESCFWPKDTEKFIYIGKPDETFNIETADSSIATKTFNYMEEGYVPSAWDFPALCVNLEAVKGTSTLLFLVPSPVSIFLENADSAKIKDIFMPMIAKLGEATEPLNVFTSHWHDDPYSRGAVSAIKPEGAFMNDGFVQGWDNVRFAGEHTISEGHGCVHGAWMSGKREAEYVIKNLK